MAVVFTTMDGFLSEKKIRSRKKKKRKVPWLLRKDALATGAGKAADIATVANAFNSYHPKLCSTRHARKYGEKYCCRATY